jgi:peptide/nickel transport system substrate-binding protein
MHKLGKFIGCIVLYTASTISGATLPQVYAETVLRVAMTAGDVPITIGQPDQGFEGYRFVGYGLYDALILWDLSRADVVADLRPGLATSWAVDPANPYRWLRTHQTPWRHCLAAGSVPVVPMYRTSARG